MPLALGGKAVQQHGKHSPTRCDAGTQPGAKHVSSVCGLSDTRIAMNASGGAKFEFGSPEQLLHGLAYNQDVVAGPLDNVWHENLCLTICELLISAWRALFILILVC